MNRSLLTLVAAVAVAAASCAALNTTTGGSAATPPTTTTTPAADTNDPNDLATTSVAATEPDDVTTTTVFERLVPISAELPPWTVITITTEDGIDLHGKYWPGDDDAVILTHEYDAAAEASAGQRPPQSSDNLLTWAGVVAEAGHTVLAVDWRGHGQSGGTYNVKESQIDLAAAYGFLVAEGHDQITALAFAGSGPVVTDLAASGLDFSALGLMWSPQQETGFDATTAITDVDEPVWIVTSDFPTLVRTAVFLERKTVNLYEKLIFPPVPTGLQFVDVYGEEFAGRLLTFIEST